MTTSSPPLFSVVLAARDAEDFLAHAVRSVLGQTVRDLELVVVDDGSRDSTPAILASVDDPRLVVLRHDAPEGLASALNRGLERATGRYVARMDADDVALPRRLELQLARLRARPAVAVVGSGVTEIDHSGRLGGTHLHPAGVATTRWQSLFGTPFFHPTAVVDRIVLDRHGLRYDAAYDAGDASTEDYDLWERLLWVADGDNVGRSLLLYRRHGGQASERRREHQLELRRRIAMRAIAAVAPELAPTQVELAWRVGDGQELPSQQVDEAVDAHLALLEAFSRARFAQPVELRPVHHLVARAIARLALSVDGLARGRILARAVALDPAIAGRVAAGRLRRRTLAREVRRVATPWLEVLGAPPLLGTRATRVVVVSPEPTPFRSLLFDRLALRGEIDLTVVYSGRTIARRTWTIVPRHRAVFLRGVPIPGAAPLLLHDYRVTPGVVAALRAARPDVVVISGWSTFACQAAVLWCRARRIPYILLVESHDAGPRSDWRRLVKGAVVPPIVRGASRVLAIGTLARASALARGARPERLALFANTIDVPAWGERADRLAGRRSELRATLGARERDVVVLSVARLSREKGLDTLLRAVAEAADPRLMLVAQGEGPERSALEALARELEVRLVLPGDMPWEQTVERYVAADVFALLSLSETWAVVVNEAAACGLPLVLSDRVGAAYDLLVDGENGVLVPAGDVAAAAAALRRYADDPAARLAAGARSRALMQDWGYGPSSENFVAAVREAAASR